MDRGCLQAELRATVFAAINEQDIAQGGIGEHQAVVGSSCRPSACHHCESTDVQLTCTANRGGLGLSFQLSVQVVGNRTCICLLLGFHHQLFKSGSWLIVWLRDVHSNDLR